MSSFYEKYQLKQVINASGRMMMLGVSTPRQMVSEAVVFGLDHFFEMKDLVNKTGAYIARLLKVESAVIVSSASAGIAQSVAAVIVKDDPNLRVNLHAAPRTVPHEIVLPKGHNVNFGVSIDTMITLGGGKVVEAGYANECSPEQLTAVITPNTAAILYIESHYLAQKNILSVEQAVLIARRHKLPLIIDAAAAEDLVCYYQMGADLVIYSGTKAIEGPASGLVLGKKIYIEWVKLQSEGIGQAMKVGKESIIGLAQAIESYMTQKKETGQQMMARMTPFVVKLNTIDGVSAKVVWDEAGRNIARTEIRFDENTIGRSTLSMVEELKNGDVAIYFRAYKVNEGKIEVDVRSVTSAQLDTIYTSIDRLIKGAESDG